MQRVINRDFVFGYCEGCYGFGNMKECSHTFGLYYDHDDK